MKYIFKLSCILLSIASYAQSDTEVFLFDLETTSSKIELKNAKNLSNNEGYDNQPSFLDNRYILFASTRNGQTDISKYDMRYDSRSWLNFSPGGEYTPLKIPNKNEVSAVRLDTDGLQRLYRYNMSNGEAIELIEDLVVAYYTWYDDHTIVSAVIEGDDLNLYATNLEDGSSRKFATKVGRSFHKIPNSNLVSFISKDNENQWQIKSLNPETGITKVIANTLEGVEDICWLNSTTILSGKDNMLYKLTLQRDNNWKQVTDVSVNGITKITRIAVNDTSDKLLLAGEISATATTETSESSSESEESTSENTATNSEVEAIVQQQLDAYNARDIDAFMATYAEDIKLYNYPNELHTEGQTKMRENYIDWFKRVPDLRAYVKQRIVIGNKVIDEEQVTANGKIFNAVAIYEVSDGKITKVTFIQ
ncbi:nuclear transport factor 2 family protein [Psychroserpens algicola]|uniref:Nuclear transport factor 2 family protein n=1 Tax=Psychroserpens algicola TaxID=1719034 RepID=A0ABT0H6M8_9FLAO|nr:nuclear transport factor 2 family protein [Psychroserpens algicola]MCK8479482.1 nuclear transport factor 2 family protein [Psychroserpens algicola]